MEQLLKIPNAPLFQDPVNEGPADPMVIWNREEKCWWMLYTARRAKMESEKHEWCFGTNIGVASSTDGGCTFTYRGELNLDFEQGKNTFWAPEVVWENGVYHMFVTYSSGISTEWRSDYKMAHLTATNMWEWKFEGFLPLSGCAFDACCLKMDSGLWRMWYRAARGVTVCLESHDLYEWKTVTENVDLQTRSEGPNVFFWKGYYWMVSDVWHGLAVFRSEDAVNWERKNDILNIPGKRPYDDDFGQHADVLVNGDNAFVYYFINTKRNRNEQGGMKFPLDFEERRSLVQVAQLDFDGENLTCDRDRQFVSSLIPEE